MTVSTHVYKDVQSVNNGIDQFVNLKPWGDSSEGINDQKIALDNCKGVVLRHMKETVQESELPRHELVKKELCKERVKLVVRITCWVIAGIMAIAAFGFTFVYLLGVISSGGVALACGAGLGALLAAAVAGGPVFGASFLLNIDCKSKSVKEGCRQKKEEIELALKRFKELAKNADQRINNIDEITALFGQFNVESNYSASGLTEAEVKDKFMKAMKKSRFEGFHGEKTKVDLPGRVSVVISPFLNRVFIDRRGSKSFGLSGGGEVKDLTKIFTEKKN